MKRTTLILLAFMLASCKIDTDKIIDTNESIKVSIYGKGSNIEEYSLSPDDKEYKQFMSWVKDNQEGWSATPATYAPKLLASGKSFAFNFMGAGVVVNYEGGQFTKNIDPKEYVFLKR